MIFFGHIGPSLYLARQAVGPEKLDLKAAACVLLWAELPDLIDKPIHLLHLVAIPTGRLWGHTLLFSLLCILLTMTLIKSQWPWVLALPGHLILDSMWGGLPTLLWPLTGLSFYIDEHVPREVLQNGYAALYH